MEVINKRCGNCGRYPFCKRTEGASCYCEEWIKRNSNNEFTIHNLQRKEGKRLWE